MKGQAKRDDLIGGGDAKASLVWDFAADSFFNLCQTSEEWRCLFNRFVASEVKRGVEDIQ